MQITIKNKISVSGNYSEIQTVKERFTFANPKHADAIKFNRSVRSIDQNIKLYSGDDYQVTLPIGTLDYLLQTFNPEIIDQRATIQINIPFEGVLRPYQERFINIAIKAKGGVMVAATGAGKTVSGIAMASHLKERTLILVKSKDLAEQWKQAIKQFTGLDSGLIGGGKNTEGGQFTIGLTQTLSKRDLSQLHYGLVIADECHNLPASQAYTVMNGLNAKYKYGLSATPQRRDNMEFMIFGVVGGIVSEIEPHELEGKVLPVSVIPIQVPFDDSNIESWTEFLNCLVDNADRNQMIVNKAIKASKKMGTIILCSQVRHCELLADLVADYGKDALVLHGQLKAKERAASMAKAPEAQLIIGTLSLLSEGLDLPHLTALIFASPVSASIDKDNPTATRLIQSIGRCRRTFKGKTKAFVLDLVDSHPFGKSAFYKRSKIYQQQGFQLTK